MGMSLMRYGSCIAITLPLVIAFNKYKDSTSYSLEVSQDTVISNPLIFKILPTLLTSQYLFILVQEGDFAT